MAEPPLPMSTERQQIASLSILLQISMLGLAFVLGHILRRHKFYYLHEASASLLIGLLVGGIARLLSPEKSFSNWFNFHEEFFFLFLLPPIIFLTESGFSMQPQPFFSNFGAICTFAILGTIISTAITGILVYLGGLLSLMYSLPFLDSLIFGSIISATDPVSVLAVFQELGPDVNLYALVFGESVLNDAVAMSLYRTLMSVRQHPSANYNMTTATWSFLVIFVGSLGSGVSVALLCALLFKYAGLHVHKLQHLECCLIVLFPYFAYMSAEGLGLSGIVAILFCGILMKHYTFPNLSESAQEFTAAFFQLIASLAETFVFMYMGVDIANERHRWTHVGFIFFSIYIADFLDKWTSNLQQLIIIVARAANVFPLAHCINKVRPASQKIPIQHQKALWFSVIGCTGLRGAMAFALALQSVHDIGDSHGQAIFTTTTTIVVLTVFVIGGSTSTMLEKLDVATDKVEYINVATADRDELDHLESASSDDDKVAVPIPKTKFTSTLRSLRRSTSFKELDRRFLRPFFTTSKSDSKLLGRPSNSFNELEINDRESSKLGHSKSDTGVHYGQSIENVSHQLQNRNPSTTQEIFQIEDEDS